MLLLSRGRPVWASERSVCASHTLRAVASVMVPSNNANVVTGATSRSSSAYSESNVLRRHTTGASHSRGVRKWSCVAELVVGAPQVGRPGWACKHARQPCTPPGGRWACGVGSQCGDEACQGLSLERSLRGAEIDLLDEQPFDGIHQALLFQRLHLTHKHTRFDCSLWISICIQWMGCRALVNANADWRRDEREEDRTHLEAFFRRHVREDEASRLALQRLQLSQPVDVVA